MNVTKNPIDISIIITAHKEGLIAHKTMLSVFQNIEQLDKDISTEVIVGLDAPDVTTARYFDSYLDDNRVTVVQSNFGEPSQNRNNTIEHANGAYVLLVDGDDLLSSNFLRTAHTIASKATDSILVHPEAHLQFGVEEDHCTLWLCEDSFSKEEDALIMSYWNRWTNVQFGKREIFLEYPFVPASDGYGYEDFHFNSETRANNIKHVVAPETVLFYRKKAVSVQAQHISQKASVPLTTLLNLNYFKVMDVSHYPSARPRSKVKAAATYLYRTASTTAQKVSVIQNAVAPTVRRVMFNKNSTRVPKWLIKEWENINRIENQLFPTEGEIAKLEFHPLSFNQHWTDFGIVYKKLADQVTKLPDYLFLPPELSVGGTEKLMFNYVRALIEIHPDWHIAVIGKRPAESPFDIPNQVDFIDFDGTTAHLGKYERGVLWSRFFVQLGVKRLHIINSKHWLTWARHYKTLLEHNNYNLYISLFMREYVHEPNRILSLADPELREVWPVVTKVFTDNAKVVDQTLENNAFEPEKFSVHYQPEMSSYSAPKHISSKKPLKILWASRISYQKRPDLLRKIAAKLGDSVSIDAYGTIEKKQFKPNYFKDSAITYKGSFSGISSLPTEKYDLYLYTSDTDGIPNILLEIAAKGLPIIASNVGGISEFIVDRETGLLAHDNSVDGFVTAIEQLRKDSKLAHSLAVNAQKKLRKQHTWLSFLVEIEKDIN